MEISLRTTLLRSLAAPLLIALMAGTWLVYGIASDIVSAAYDESLANLAQGVANRVTIDHGVVRLDLPPEAEAVLRTDRVDRIYFRVRDEKGGIVAGDPDIPPPDVPVLTDAPYFYEAEYDGQAIRVVRLHPNRDREGFYVTVAETMGKRTSAVGDLLIGAGIAVMMVISAVAAVVVFGIPNALAPILRVQREILDRSGNDLAPIHVGSVPLEIRPLVTLLNAQLERLRAANLAQREFLQNAAHQLRTPLASLQVELELLEGGTADAAALSRLRRSVSRVTRLANQLLALARAESGERLIADAPRVDLAKLIDEMLDDWLAAADKRGIDLGVERDHVTLVGDPTLLHELLANLMDNAIKYVPDHGQITLRCQLDQGFINIEVTDNGPGIPETERERVFERFHRLPGSSVSGSGLGLPIAREIVRAHGGSITIDSPEGGQGTCVRVRLPAAAPRTTALASGNQARA